MDELTERNRRFLKPLDLCRFGLEIGPSHSPILPKSAAFHVETLGHLDQAGFYEKYRNNPDSRRLVARIETVVFVTGGKSILEVVCNKQKYDFVIGSHERGSARPKIESNYVARLGNSI